MTAAVLIDPALHGSSIPATYVAPGYLLNLGVPVRQAPGSSTGTLGSNGGITTYAGDTYTIIAANSVQDFEDDEFSGYFTGAGDVVVIPVGFNPMKVSVIDWTGVVKWEWMYGAPATDTLKVVTAGTETSDTGSAITVTTDPAGNCVVALSATLAVSTHVLSFRIEG